MTGRNRGLRDRDKPALIVADSGTVLSQAELDDRTARLTGALMAAGLVPGDVVALLSANTAHAFEVLYATRRSGLVFAALDHMLGLEELAFVINDSGAKALFVGAGLEPLGEELARLTPQIAVRYTSAGSLPGYLGYEASLAGSSGASRDEPVATQIHYSSGTNGRPRRARVTRPNRPAELRRTPVLAALSPYSRIDQDTVLFSATPLSDPVAAQLVGAVLLSGGTVVSLAEFSAESALTAIAENRVNLVHLLPSAMRKLVRLPQPLRSSTDLSALAAAVHSSAACPDRIKRELIDWWGPIVHEFYGGAEYGALSFISAEDWLMRPGSLGRSLVGVAHGCDASGHELPPGSTGVIHFDRSPVPSQRGDESVAVHPRMRGRVTLGDVGMVDDEGFIFLAGRNEVEDLLCLHPKVADLAVVQDPGTAPRLLVQPEPGVPPMRALELELLAYLQSRIPSHQMPSTLEFMRLVPRTGAGRLIRRRLGSSYQPVAAAWV